MRFEFLWEVPDFAKYTFNLKLDKPGDKAGGYFSIKSQDNIKFISPAIEDTAGNAYLGYPYVKNHVYETYGQNNEVHSYDITLTKGDVLRINVSVFCISDEVPSFYFSAEKDMQDGSPKNTIQIPIEQIFVNNEEASSIAVGGSKVITAVLSPMRAFTFRTTVGMPVGTPAGGLRNISAIIARASGPGR